MTSLVPARVAEHVAAFNAAVRSGDWGLFAERFAPGAVVRDTVRFGWTRGGTGIMVLTWQDGLIASLDVTFDGG